MNTRANLTDWQETSVGPPVSSLVVTWLALFPIAVCAVHGAFSFFARLNGGLIVASAALAQSADSSQATSTRVVIRMTMVLVIVLYATVVQKTFVVLQQNLLLMSLVVLSTLSVLWSQDVMITLQSSFALILTTLLGMYLTQRFTALQLMRLMALAGWLLMASSLILAVAFPSFGVFHGTVGDSMGWKGIYPHKNVLGTITVFFLTPMLCLPISGRIAKASRIVYILLAFFLIGMSESRGAWLICAAMLMFFAFTKTATKFRPRDRTVLYLLVGAIGIGVVVAGIALLPTIVNLIGKDVTLTGRTGIWQELFVSIAKRPLLGYGYGAFWLGLKEESARMIFAINWASLGYAENGLIDLCLQVGLVGIGLFIASFIQACRRLIRLPRE